MIDWAEIVERHGPDVWRTAYRLLSRRDEANDCYQDTFLQAVEYSRKQTVDNWAGVLRRIATARALDRLRKRYRRQTEALVEDSAVASREPDPDEFVQLRESMDQLREALLELPEKHAEAFWLCEVELLSRDDVARQLAASPKEVAVWLHRAKRKLRTLLSKWRIEK